MKTTKILISICVVLFLTTIQMTAQVTIGSQNAPNASAVLDLQTTNKGLLLPRVALTSTTAATPLSAHVAGMTVYNTATVGTGNNAVAPGQYYNDGTKWIRIQEYTEQVDPTFMVWVNTPNPNTATAFDNVPYYDEDGGVNPDFTNDNTLKAGTSYLYIGTDGSNWNYNGTTYITYKAAIATEWNLSGSTVDAGSNKTATISRTGGVGVGGSVPFYSKFYVFSDKWASLSDGSKQSIGAYVSSALAAGSGSANHFQLGLLSKVTTNVASGNSNTGYAVGLAAQAFRRSSTNGGTLSIQKGVEITYGHYQDQVTGTTIESHGLEIRPYVQSGTVTNMYDIYVTNTSGIGIGTVTNKYGLYLLGADKINYFAGKLGLATTTPDQALHVKGGVLVEATGTGTAGGTTNGTSATNGTYINSNGYVASQSTGTYSLYLSKASGYTAGLAAFYVNGTTVGTITTNGTNTTYNTTSDARLKENVTNTSFGLTDIMKMNVKDYNFKSDDKKALNTGFIAQDLYNVYPQAVTVGGENEKEDPWMVDYSKLVPVLVKAIQDQQKIIDQQEVRIKALESK